MCKRLHSVIAAAVFVCACCAVSTALAATAPDNTLTKSEKADGWELLFDGKTFNNWNCTDPQFTGWSVSGGVIELSRGGKGLLYTKKRFANFELKMDFKVAARTNSGLFFRWDDLGDPVQTGLEMQILDSFGRNPPGRHDCGALYDILAPSENAVREALQWNSVILSCRNNWISVNMNGKRILRADLDRYTEPRKNLDGTRNKFARAIRDFPRSGHIGLQAHGGAAWFKNIKIREIR